LKKLLASFFLTAACAFSLLGFSQEAEKKLEDAIKNEYLKEYPSMIVSSIKIDDMTKENRQNFVYKALEMQKQNMHKDNGVVLAIFETEKNATKRVFVRYKIEALMSIVKAKYNLQKDKIITSDDIVTENIQFKNFSSKPLSESAAKGLATKRFIGFGTILTEKDAAKPSVIKKNSSQYASMYQQGLEIELEVIAMQDGNTGETISVKAKNGMIMRALINQNNKLEIQ